MSKFVLTGFGDEISPNLETQLKVMKKLSISYLEARGVNDVNVADLTKEQALEAKKTLDEYGFAISAVGSPVGKWNITDDLSAHIDMLKRVIETAKIFDAKYIRMFSFYYPKEENVEKYKDVIFEEMAKMVALAKSNDVILLHENERGIYGDTAARNKELADEFYGDNFKLIYDFANFVTCGEADVWAAYQLLKPYIHYFHAKDFRTTDNSVMPCGMGEGKVSQILQDAKDSGFEGFVSIEPHLGMFKGLEAFDNDPLVSKEMEGGEKTFTVAYSAIKGIIEKLK